MMTRDELTALANEQVPDNYNPNENRFQTPVYKDRDSCNGWKNYITWEIYQAIDTDFDLWKENSLEVYSLTYATTREEKDELAVLELGRMLEDYFTQQIDELEESGVVTDWRLSAMRNCFGNVDWCGLSNRVMERSFER